MCGIAGIVTFAGSPDVAPAGALARMAAQMRRRGPDDAGFLLGWDDGRAAEAFFGEDTDLNAVHSGLPFAPRRSLGDAAGVAAAVGLAHRRLSIVDLSPTGHQPMCTRDRRFWIVYNGEVYNAAEIRSRLEGRGIQFFGRSDTEVLLNAYAAWGPDCLDLLNGMFAFAIWDDREKTLFCARDRIGIKPFYYVRTDEHFLFASDIKTLIASGIYEPAVDVEGLYHGLAFGIAPRPMTAFRGVRALEQGTWMRISADGRSETRRWWRIPTGVQEAGMTEAEAVELVEEKLLKAVERRLVADVEVGTFMSGGIDSTTVSAMAARKQPGINAFTLTFPEECVECNEVEQARAAAAMHPMRHIEEFVQPEAVLESLQDMVLGYEEPCHHLAANLVISQAVARRGLRVILNGLGGDELFGGYAYYRWANRWKCLRAAAPFLKPLRRFGRRFDVYSEVGSAATADRMHTAYFSVQTNDSRRRLFESPEVRRFNTLDRLHDLYVGGDVRFTDEIEALSYMDLMNYVGNHHVHRTDQFTMHHSIEGRFPMLDHELVEAAMRIPSRHKVRGDVSKYVLRKVAGSYIPQACLDMPKKGFGLPVDRWLRGPLKELMLESLNGLKKRGLFRPAEIDRRLRLYLAGRLHYSAVTVLTATELWMRTFIDDGGMRCVESRPHESLAA